MEELQSLFIYGSLRESDIQREVIGREIKDAEEDFLDDYRREFIRLDRFYPIVFPNPGSSVEGSVISVTQEELEGIDRYEGKAYQRQRVVLRSGKSAWVYQKPETH